MPRAGVCGPGRSQAYAARVAGTVGAMMALLMGQRAAEVLARACDLGRRDAAHQHRARRRRGRPGGRLYLPLDWLREAGIDPDAWLAEPVFTEALA